MEKISKYSILIAIIVSFIIATTTSCTSPKTSSANSIAPDSVESNLTESSEILDKTTYHIDMETAIGKSKELHLSALAKSIKYVPLETTTKYMIGENSVKIKPCAEYIFVSEHGKTIGVFDLAGNFIRTIGSIGKGPEEYNFDYNFWPDETTRRTTAGA